MFARHSKYILSLCLLLALPFTAFCAAPQKYIEGQDYIKLPAEMRKKADIAELLLEDPNKVQVLLFFSYGCPACARFDPYFETWMKKQTANKQLVIHWIPASFEEQWDDLATMYYVMKQLDPKQTLSSKIFVTIHEKKQPLWQESLMQDFFVQNGYTAEQFTKAYKSFGVGMETKNAQQLSVAYAINQTPTIIVNGPYDSYRLNVDKVGGDINKFFKVLDYVLAEQNKLLTKKH